MTTNGEATTQKTLADHYHLVARTAPHFCDVPDCPGPVNKRKLEAFEELLDSLVRLIDSNGGCDFDFTSDELQETCLGENDPQYGIKCPWCQARAAIARASPQASHVRG